MVAIWRKLPIQPSSKLRRSFPLPSSRSGWKQTSSPTSVILISSSGSDLDFAMARGSSWSRRYRIEVGPPVGRRVAHAQDFVGVLLDERDDLLARRLDLVVSSAAKRLLHPIQIVLVDGLWFALEERLVPAVQDALGATQVGLHRTQDGVDLVDVLLGLQEEAVDSGVLRLPGQLADAGLDDLVKLLQIRLDQWLLHGQQVFQNSVVGGNDEIQVRLPATEHLHLAVDLQRQLGNAEAEEQEVFHLPEETHQRRVEVDPKEPRLRISQQQAEAQLRLRRRLDVATPLLDLLALVLLQRRQDGGVDLGNFLGLLTLQDGAIQLLQLDHGDFDALHEPAAPRERPGDGREVPGRRRCVAVLEEDLLQVAQVAAVALHETDVLLLELVLDDGPLQQALEAVQQLEAAVHGGAVIKGQADHGAQAPLQFLHGAAEVVEVVVELLGAHVHDVVGNLLERLHRQLEVRVDLLHRGRQRLPLGAADLDLREFAELHDGLHQVQDVMAALEEAVQAHEERVVLDAPRIAGALGVGGGAVVEVGVLETAAHAKRHLELISRGLGVVILDEAEDLLAAHVAAGLIDQRVADLAHEHHQPRRRVVVLAVLPDEQDDVQHRLEELQQRREVVQAVQLDEPVLQRAEVLHVVVGLQASGEDLLAQARERLAVGALGLV
eukprot:scaffold1298_cov257-Pinguiococcus_pyrenoidosus.AAC.2